MAPTALASVRNYRDMANPIRFSKSMSLMAAICRFEQLWLRR
jgi:hypothetical protein